MFAPFFDLQLMGAETPNAFEICYPFPEKYGIKYAKTMILLRFLVYYAIPLIIIGVFYVLIARHLMYSANVPGEMQGAVRQVSDKRKFCLVFHFLFWLHAFEKKHMHLARCQSYLYFR